MRSRYERKRWQLKKEPPRIVPRALDSAPASKEEESVRTRIDAKKQRKVWKYKVENHRNIVILNEMSNEYSLFEELRAKVFSSREQYRA